MTTYIFTVEAALSLRKKGSVVLNVFKISDDGEQRPDFIATEVFQTAAWKGGQSEASNIVARVEGLAISDGYKLDREDIHVFGI